MKHKLFNSLPLFSLFGIALGFFGMLYEGVVVIPKMIDSSEQRMQFWNAFYSTISPLTYYIPIVPAATLTTIILYFYTLKQQTLLKRYLKFACLFQVVSLLLTFYIVTQVNLKMYFSDIEKYSAEISSKTLLVNILSIVRLLITGVALRAIFMAYIVSRKDRLAS